MAGMLQARRLEGYDDDATVGHDPRALAAAAIARSSYRANGLVRGEQQRSGDARDGGGRHRRRRVLDDARPAASCDDDAVLQKVLQRPLLPSPAQVPLALARDAPSRVRTNGEAAGVVGAAAHAKGAHGDVGNRDERGRVEEQQASVGEEQRLAGNDSWRWWRRSCDVSSSRCRARRDLSIVAIDSSRRALHVERVFGQSSWDEKVTRWQNR